MYNKVKSEFFIVTSTEWIAIFQASLKLVREEPRGQLSNNNYKCDIPWIKLFMWRRIM